MFQLCLSLMSLWDYTYNLEEKLEKLSDKSGPLWKKEEKEKEKDREIERERDRIYFTLNDLKNYEIQQNNNSTFQL